MVRVTPSKVLRLLGLFILSSAALVIVSSINVRKDEPPVSSTAQPNLLSRSDHGLGNDDQELFTFVQLTDLHISMFADPTRTEQLWEFCSITLNAVSPQLVIVSGDLTDGVSHENRLVPVDRQFEKEWMTYSQFHQHCLNVTGIENWLDIRGNHDNFNVDGYNSSTSFYPKYGVQRESPGSYMVKINASAHTQYAFVAVDATLDYGLTRFFNFIGILDKPEKLVEFQTIIENDPKINDTIWFGHYPTSSISSLFSAGPTLREIAAKGIVYLCGHLHREPLHLLPQMYALHPSGMLELELSDWKSHRTYRVAAMDKGLFSFVDVKHGTWPVILVTNPKPAETVQPSKEPTVLMATSNYIRLLIYSPSTIQLCEVRINEGPWITCNLTGKIKPLYTAFWNPDLYSKGKHVLEARARDSSGALNSVKFEFSLDGTRSEFSSFFGQLVLKINFASLSLGAFCFLVIALVLPFWIIRCCVTECPQNWFCRKMWLFANNDIILFPFSFYTLVWLPFLPWFIGYVTDAHIGYVFAWGTFVNGHFVLGTFSYFYGWLHMVSFNLPLIFLLANAADLRYEQWILQSAERKETFVRDWLAAIIFLFLQLFINYLFSVCFGAMATVFNPMRTWSLLLAVYLWLKVTNRTQSVWNFFLALFLWFKAKWTVF